MAKKYTQNVQRHLWFGRKYDLGLNEAPFYTYSIGKIKRGVNVVRVDGDPEDLIPC